MSAEKKIPGVNVGERVEVYHEGRKDFQMTGTVKQNDAEICVIGRDDVPPAEIYIGDGITTRAVRKEVPWKVYIFGTAQDVTGRVLAVKVNRI